MTTLTIRIDIGTLKKLKALAKEDQRSMTREILWLIQKEYEHRVGREE